MQQIKNWTKLWDNVFWLLLRISTAWTQGHTRLDPALSIYKGCLLVFTSGNSHLEDLVSWGNQTWCEVETVKLKKSANVVIKNYYDIHICSPLADQVEYLHLIKITTLKWRLRLNKLQMRLSSKWVTLMLTIMRGTNFRQDITMLKINCMLDICISAGYW